MRLDNHCQRRSNVRHLLSRDHASVPRPSHQLGRQELLLRHDGGHRQPTLRPECGGEDVHREADRVRRLFEVRS